jgi:HD-GYP domain-containing protein (c-di-GMP phosphodiesterase class II)
MAGLQSAEHLIGLASTDMSQVVGLCRTIGSVLDADKLMLALGHELAGIFHANHVTLLFHDPAQGLLCSPAGQDGITLRVDNSVSGQVFQSQRAILIRDAYACPALIPDLSAHRHSQIRSMMIAPLRTGDEACCGVVQVMHNQVDHFSESDLELFETILMQVTSALHSARKLTSQRRQFDSFVGAVARALDARDHHTHVHSINVANYCQGIAYYLGLDAREQEWLRIAGLLHDVGKIATPVSILSKPGPLTEDEQKLMREHATHTGSILSQIEFIDEYKGMHHIVAAHHEKLDGSGYPWGLTAQQITLRTRIISVADIFDALTQDRPYRKGMSVDQALETLEQMTPHQIDASCVEALKRFIGKWPATQSA